MSKHTPGPWTPYNSDKGRILSHWYVRVDGGPTIITVHNGLPDNQDMGNAHLIAAAPAMYEALLLAMQALEELAQHPAFEGDAEEFNAGGYGYIALSKAQTALAQAEGSKP